MTLQERIRLIVSAIQDRRQHTTDLLAEQRAERLVELDRVAEYQEDFDSRLGAE